MEDELEWPDRLFCLHPIVKTFGDMITYPERKEYVLIDHLKKLECLIEQMACLIRVADFEDIGDYHASLEVLKQCENI